MDNILYRPYIISSGFDVILCDIYIAVYRID